MTSATAAALSAAPAAALVASCLVFAALRPTRPAPDADAAARGGRRILGLFFRDYWYWLHAPLVRLALRSGASPDALTLAGLAVTLGAGLAFAVGNFGLGGWLIVAGGALDILDGKVARARGITRPAGAFLDSTLDRYGDWALFAGLAVAYGRGWPQWAALLALGGTFVVSYARARGEGLGVACREGWLQRGERFFFLASAGILTPIMAYFGVPYAMPMAWVLVLLAVLANVTAAWRLRVLYRQLVAAPGAEAS